MADHAGKTEEPTQRRLEKARREGQFPAAKEFVGSLQFLVFLSLLAAWGPNWFAQFRQTARSLLVSSMSGDLSADQLTLLTRRIAWQNMMPLVTAGLLVAATTLAFRLMTTRFGISLKKLAPDANRFNPISKLQELPKQNGPAVFQALVLLPLFLWACYAVGREKLEIFLALPMMSVESGWSVLGSSLMELFWKAAVVFLVFGSVDLFRQLRRYKRDMRMSKQDIKDEYKEVEGNPQMKQRIRRLQRDRARRRMMKEVPTATAVVVNPTHFAVAIRYHLETMAAPLVVAKGKNYLALRIKQKAIENQVPIIENPPLAQALYKSVDVGQEIPPHLYRAVAEILAYIFKLMNGRLPG
jgi:flagellar biosynthetic protein FlhB